MDILINPIGENAGVGAEDLKNGKVTIYVTDIGNEARINIDSKKAEQLADQINFLLGRHIEKEFDELESKVKDLKKELLVYKTFAKNLEIRELECKKNINKLIDKYEKKETVNE